MENRNKRTAVIPLCFRENTSVHIIPLIIFIVADTIIFSCFSVILVRVSLCGKDRRRRWRRRQKGCLCKHPISLSVDRSPKCQSSGITWRNMCLL